MHVWYIYPHLPLFYHVKPTIHGSVNIPFVDPWESVMGIWRDDFTFSGEISLFSNWWHRGQLSAQGLKDKNSGGGVVTWWSLSIRWSWQKKWPVGKGIPPPWSWGLTINHRCEHLLTKNWDESSTDLVAVPRLYRFKGLMNSGHGFISFPHRNPWHLSKLPSRKETWLVEFPTCGRWCISSDDSCSLCFPNSMNGSVFALGLTLPPTKEGGSFLMKVLMFFTSNTQMQHVCMTMKTTNQPKNPKQSTATKVKGR